MTHDQLPNSLTVAIRKHLPSILPDFLLRQRWFGGKARAIEAATVLETMNFSAGNGTAVVVLARVKYAEGAEETYAIPLMLEDARRERVAKADPSSTLELDFEGTHVHLSDAFQDKDFTMALLEGIREGKTFKSETGELIARPSNALCDAMQGTDFVPEPSVMRGEQSNTSVRFGERFIFKFFRRVEQGMNPDVEIGTFLTEKTSFRNSAAVLGVLEYRNPQLRPCALGILQNFVINQGDAWRYTLNVLRDYFDRVRSVNENVPTFKRLRLDESFNAEIPAHVPEKIGAFWEAAGLLGRRTGELHVALASDASNPDFRPDPFSFELQQSQYDSMRGLAGEVLRILEKRIPTLQDSIRESAEKLLNREGELLGKFSAYANHRLAAECIRIHGDYHLGQVLFTGSDFVIIDFEGEPARPLEERRKKRCALQDVAGMLRSFQYAAYSACQNLQSNANSPGAENILSWAKYWQWWVSVKFLKEYLSAAANSKFIPSSEDEFEILLNAFLLEKAVYELGYELNNRPEWVGLPLQGIHELLDS